MYRLQITGAPQRMAFQCRPKPKTFIAMIGKKQIKCTPQVVEGDIRILFRDESGQDKFILPPSPCFPSPVFSPEASALGLQLNNHVWPN